MEHSDKESLKTLPPLSVFPYIFQFSLLFGASAARGKIIRFFTALERTCKLTFNIKLSLEPCQQRRFCRCTETRYIIKIWQYTQWE